jgi:hypothetical protein
LNSGIVDENTNWLQPLGGLANVSRSLSIAEIAGKDCHSTLRAFRPYLAGGINKRRLIARDQQQIGAMRGQLASTQPT